METFDPKRHLIQLKGKQYLETRWRVVWFRQDHPRGCITTEIVSLEPPIVKATIFDGEGAVLATAHASAVDNGNAVWSGRAIEKSETAAIGRALAHAGYGTQFAGIEEQGDPVYRRRADGGERMVERAAGSGNAERVAERGTAQPAQPPQRRPTPSVDPSREDLRDKDNAGRFIQHWRNQSLSDAEVLAALGVNKLSQWTKGRAAADEAVNAWLQAKLASEST